MRPGRHRQPTIMRSVGRVSILACAILSCVAGAQAAGVDGQGQLVGRSVHPQLTVDGCRDGLRAAHRFAFDSKVHADRLHYLERFRSRVLNDQQLEGEHTLSTTRTLPWTDATRGVLGRAGLVGEGIGPIREGRIYFWFVRAEKVGPDSVRLTTYAVRKHRRSRYPLGFAGDEASSSQVDRSDEGCVSPGHDLWSTSNIGRFAERTRFTSVWTGSELII